MIENRFTSILFTVILMICSSLSADSKNKVRIAIVAEDAAGIYESGLVSLIEAELSANDNAVLQMGFVPQDTVCR